MINECLLEQTGAKRVFLEKNQIIFKEGETARYYYQIVTGAVKMNNFNDEGKEFIQGIFVDGNSFGEPPLLINDNYPANAAALIPTTVLQLTKERFLNLLFQNPKVHLDLTTTLAKRLYFKTIMASEISSQDPEHRIIKLIDHFKLKISKVPQDLMYKVDITRQQIADLTGLRVETVIRAIKSLEKKGEITIKDHKVFR
ncbi:Crp/Fnr family transcriptional regulator [Pedobacter changchengzhani]|uniref:Crp/Fnr family transcriptional regulator n=1 Tax=Pedobacter changchengzhani TaxID=2529274 RepID=A0A4R5MP00_9SPHI|nr:Crp/Fnr family transcriptional regulator [Pedobacter changchengzhani]TDG37418.1 Crp/Fnr family transcriptional regulator [Pedobacter changchengzhani]